MADQISHPYKIYNIYTYIYIYIYTHTHTYLRCERNTTNH